ncbi:efflux transporter periplasmic adaptor subunit [Xaviernesmea oryzae]|uniref:Efflux transporter periplasmic adaptor subunit n=1 Tax=Xaviernesmea oryzae TaxID=464029 RepID=A0A1Q9B3I8_9HYPH|nr:efflux RND transporter periplasmic adaptor subunit [Xaviernesmea oryzae]OLP62620.1 efflux transporter periplasmic adaptor subunit [Xaviernesmea oryzae]SEM25624.1 RND family efflux transporter, MFP subunit [Xaviernesmea oryzae]
MKKVWIPLVLIGALGAGAWAYRGELPDLAARLQAVAPFEIPGLKALAGSTQTAQAESTSGQHRHDSESDQGGTAGQGGQGGKGGEGGKNGQPGKDGQSGQTGGKGGGRHGGGGPAAVKTVAAQTGILPMDIPATGFAVADQTTTLAAREQGSVTELVAQDGQTVKAGDLIVKLDDRTARAAVAKDNAAILRDSATLSEAETALRRAHDLVNAKAGTQQSLDQAQSARDQAAATVEADKATLSADQVLLEHTEIRAPFDGRLGEILVSPGAYLSAGASVVKITKFDPVYVGVHLEERSLRRLRLAMADGSVSVTTVPSSDKGQVRTGTVSFFDNAVDPASGTILVKARFDNPSGALWPGQSVNIVLHLKNDAPQVVVPTVAVGPGPDGSIAYVVHEGKVAVANVEVGRVNGDYTSVTAGLSPGDHVVIEGQAALYPGQQVKESFDDQALDLAAADPAPLSHKASVELAR